MNIERAGRAGDAARAVANKYREQRAIVRSRRRRGRIGERSRATYRRSVLLPLEAERGSARHRYRESRRLPNGDIRADRWRRNGRGR